MTTDDDTGHDDDQNPEPAGISSTELKEAIREVIAELGLGASSDEPKGGSTEDEPEPITVKDIEAAARRAVEEAMEPLREAVAKKSTPKAKPKAKPAPEPEPSPAEGKGNKWRKLVWGDDD